MKITATLLLPALCLLAFPLFTQADVLFFDGFEDDAVGSGNTLDNWTQSDTTRVYAVNSTSHTGANSLFMRHSGTRSLTQINAIDITGTSGLLVSWWMMQGTDDQESNESFIFSMDFGSGMQTVLTDKGEADGGVFNYSGTELNNPTDTGKATSFVKYSVSIDSSYYLGDLEATAVKLKFYNQTGSNNENLYIDDISITAVPEPTAVTLLVIGFAALMICRRKN
ncbi:PEP-CTERM sorting domain-containing protein [Kiritimatiellota bacterium B12222]|nr:PEP-CTERM sorting domain-containing protein [Kiritimatiellota bacterium B12222]